MKKLKLLTGLAVVGLLDSAYLTHKHYKSGLAPCTQGFFSSCNDVLTSSYSQIFGIPLALLGAIHYGLFTIVILIFINKKHRYSGSVIVLLSYVGLIVSAYLVYLQAAVLNAYCIFCMVSALTSLLIFVLVWKKFYKQRKFLYAGTTSICYKYFLKPILFRLNPEKVHENFVSLGQAVGTVEPARASLGCLLKYENKILEQEIEGLVFPNPIGLAAGFDYDAKLSQVLDSVGFGFHTAGTVTNMEYEGNPRPRLGRLPKSRSLMVNKGFKSEGADAIIDRIFGKFFKIPFGVSIGRTNTRSLRTQKQSVDDIVEAFTKFESLSLNHDYYELNISCPNLFGDITFYPPDNLEELLVAVQELKLSRPVFIKMPIEISDEEVLQMLEIIDKYRIQGVIFGNLQKDREHRTLDQQEVAQFKKGNFSGKPTFKRSNELISLAYKNFKNRFVIIGCGGVFSAEGAYEKIKRGANLVQLITGMIFEGPQLISQINQGLVDHLKKDGYENISQAVGKADD